MEDKFRMTVAESIFYAKRAIVDLIYKSARLEGLAVTFPDTYSVVSAGIINGMSFEDAQIINNLKHAWQFIIDTVDAPMSLPYVCQIHKLVGESLTDYNAGFLRDKPVYVNIGEDEPWTPPLLIEADARDEIDELLRIEPPTARAVSLMLHLSRRQMFNDGNKRVAMLAANQIMLANGAGIISVPPSKIPQFVARLVAYYKSGDMSDAMSFVYDECIAGDETKAVAQSHARHVSIADRAADAQARLDDRRDAPTIGTVQDRGDECG